MKSIRAIAYMEFHWKCQVGMVCQVSTLSFISDSTRRNQRKQPKC